MVKTEADRVRTSNRKATKKALSYGHDDAAANDKTRIKKNSVTSFFYKLI